MNLSPGEVLLDRYEVVRPLGHGGMATAWLVFDRLFRSQLALKAIPSRAHPLAQALRQEFAVLMSHLHPSLVRVHDFGTWRPGTPSSPAPAAEPISFLTTEFVDGDSLLAFASNRSWRQVLPAVLDLLQALRVLHRTGIRHGDLKPANVIVRPNGRSVLIDLGCAAPLSLGRQTHVSGTPAFLAPELLAGDASDQRADLFALGVTLRKVTDALRDRPPARILRLVSRLVEKDPADRPSDVDEVLECLGGEPSRLPPALDRIGRLAGRVQETSVAASVLSSLASGAPGPRALHVMGPRGVGRSRFLRELKWDAQQKLTVVEAHPAAPESLLRALRSVLLDESLPCELGAALSALAKLDDRAPRPALLLLDDLEGLPDEDRRLVIGLARSLSSTSRLGVIMAECTGRPLEADAVVEIELAPLTFDEMKSWLEPRLDDLAIRDLAEASGGFPDRIERAIGAQPTTKPARPDRPWPALPSPAKRVLGLLVAREGTLTAPDLEVFRIERDALLALHRAALVAHDGPTWKLVRSCEDDVARDAVGQQLLCECRREVAAALMARARQATAHSPRASRLLALAVRQLALAGELDQAVELSQQAEPELSLAYAPWARALEALAAVHGDPRIAMQAARCEIESGRIQQGIDRLELLVRSCQDPQVQAEADLEAGRGYARVANYAAAMKRLLRALRRAPDPAREAAACDALARVCTRQGAYREASSWATRGLSLSPAPPLQASLLCSAGIASSYLGDLDDATVRLSEATRLIGDAGVPAELVRILGSKGVNDYRAGRLADAADSHAKALDVARRHELHASVASAALNLGAVLHQQAAYLQAQQAYERGLQLAVALALHGTEAWLLYDLAKLQADLGQLDRAQQTVERSRALASRTGSASTVAATQALLGEIACLRGDSDDGLALLSRSRDEFSSQGSAAEHLELELQIATAHLWRGDPRSARASLSAAASLMNDGPAPSRDVRVLHGLVEARCAVAEGRPEHAIAVVEPVLAEATILGLRDCEAEAHALLAAAWDSQGARSVARRQREKARELYERISVGMPPAMRETFWRHPRRRGIATYEADDADGAEPVLASRFRLLLELNKRINSSLSVDDVLRRAMDGAIELTGAERGFLLLADAASEGQLHVAVARNVDREQVSRSHLKFSRSIAERVIATREPVITTDARADARFQEEASVLAMSLQSVVCVPVESPAGVLGALYLDNRFRRGRFRDVDAELLQALADQVAIALSNARLHTELEARSRQLDDERKRVQAMADERAVELDRLHEEVRQTRQSLGRRHAFARIVGGSVALQRALEVLDRVVDTPVPVLIEGESGTGKELFARAIHEHGSRRERPFVAINCGAMPEALLESELFGHERGAFTGADRAREGLLVMCRGGTLFLDEIGEMPMAMQVKLLRVLQEREVRPLGAASVIPVDFRLVSATNRRLGEEAARGAFREDLFYRISAVQIRVPPLRERRDDTPLLADHLLARASGEMGRATPKLSRAAQRKLAAHDWPGNVRQLENVLLKALIMAEGDRIEADDIELPEVSAPQGQGESRTTFEQDEVRRIAGVLRAHRWNITRALPELGIPRATLYRLMKRHGMLRSG